MSEFNEAVRLKVFAAISRIEYDAAFLLSYVAGEIITDDARCAAQDTLKNIYRLRFILEENGFKEPKEA